MLWSRRMCPFGLPDEAEDIDNIVLASIGHVLRAATTDIVETPLPARFVNLLGRLERRERNARTRRRPAVRRQHAKLQDAIEHRAPRPQPADR